VDIVSHHTHIRSKIMLRHTKSFSRDSYSILFCLDSERDVLILRNVIFFCEHFFWWLNLSDSLRKHTSDGYLIAPVRYFIWRIWKNQTVCLLSYDLKTKKSKFPRALHIEIWLHITWNAHSSSGWVKFTYKQNGYQILPMLSEVHNTALKFSRLSIFAVTVI